MVSPMIQVNNNTINNILIPTIVLLSILLVLSSCGNIDENSQPEIGNIADQTLNIGEETRIKINIIDTDSGDRHEIKVESNNENVAQVQISSITNFTIIGIAHGAASITVLVRDDSYEDNDTSNPMVFDVTVLEATPSRDPTSSREPHITDEDYDLAANRSVTISEIMYAAEDKFTPPQWIELHNASTKRINLRGWRVLIQNKNTPDLTRPQNVDVEFTFDDDFWDDAPMLPPNGTVLISSSGVNDHINTTDLPENQIYDLIWRTNLPFGLWDTMLSVEAFSIKLFDGRETLIDEVGNFNGSNQLWQFDLEHRGKTKDGFRSSVLRRYHNGYAVDGKQKNSWIPTVNAKLNKDKLTYYGDKNDISSPGIPPDIGQ